MLAIGTKRKMYISGFWILFVYVYLTIQQSTEIEGLNTIDVDCYNANFSKYNVETVPQELYIYDATAETNNKSITVTWWYDFNEDTCMLGGFMVWFTTCKLVLLPDSYNAGTKKSFMVLFPGSSGNLDTEVIQVVPLVTKGSIEIQQWKGNSFLYVTDHNIEVTFTMPNGIKSMEFYLYMKGKVSPVSSEKVNGSVVVKKNLPKGLYHYQLDNIESDLSSNNCPCYVKVLGKKMCRQCERKYSNEFCVPKCPKTTTSSVVIETTSESHTYSIPIKDESLHPAIVLAPVFIAIAVLLIAVTLFCYYTRDSFSRCYQADKYNIHSRVIVLYQSAGAFHNRVVRRLCTVLKHFWHVESIEIDNGNSKLLEECDRKEIFKTIIVTGAHCTLDNVHRLRNTMTENSVLFTIQDSYRPVIVSYSESTTTAERHFLADIETYDLKSQLWDLLNNLHGSDIQYCCLSKLSFDMKCLQNAINKAGTKVEDSKQDDLENQSHKSSYKFTDNLSFIQRHKDNLSSVYNDALEDKFETSNTDRFETLDESISIGGKSV